ncbi:hypothetical protein J2S49_000886 [Arcanobacterium wilhelmae]|uniref:FHA domain-containing protein n=1 Tax=Arcanobacterium wilhelmae TaxID=1803177 RepID=A0ABT9NAR1_9ACTO|nr:hypothetical protein [Arcanobacterium wilhelmae]MDP9800810.1 hypothetical protein [Arcanobacterium wilhelmae]WFN90186.1 hypothetical protein P8A24_08375 [Arcanobacterium wilhelmae]
MHTRPSLEIDFAGEYYHVTPGQVFVIGRVGDLAIDDNPFLHRHFLELSYQDGLWWVANVGSRIAVTVAESSGQMQSWVGPGTRLPLVMQNMSLVFTAGPTTYEIDLTIPESVYQTTNTGKDEVGQTTVGQVALTPSQKLLIVALAEPWLTRIGTGASDIPTSAAAAARLGWTQTKFNRKLDNVCDKLAGIGVRGLKSDSTGNATHRRSRLVEYAVASQLVVPDDVALLDKEYEANTDTQI